MIKAAYYSRTFLQRVIFDGVVKKILFLTRFLCWEKFNIFLWKLLKLTHWFSDFKRNLQIFFLNKKKSGLQGHIQKWFNPKASLLNIPLKKTRDKLLEISYGKILGYICSEEALTFRNSKNSWKRYAAKTKEDYPLPLCRVGRTLNQLAKWEPL